MSTELVNIIFGMKIRQYRTEASLSLSEFAELCQLSPSYVTEIEKGKKYPRPNKIRNMADVLHKEYDELVSIKLDSSLTYLEQTLASPLVHRFPFDEFGLEASDLVSLLTQQSRNPAFREGCRYQLSKAARYTRRSNRRGQTSPPRSHPDRHQSRSVRPERRPRKPLCTDATDHHGDARQRGEMNLDGDEARGGEGRSIAANEAQDKP